MKPLHDTSNLRKVNAFSRPTPPPPGFLSPIMPNDNFQHQGIDHQSPYNQYTVCPYQTSILTVAKIQPSRFAYTDSLPRPPPCSRRHLKQAFHSLTRCPSSLVSDTQASRIAVCFYGSAVPAACGSPSALPHYGHPFAMPRLRLVNGGNEVLHMCGDVRGSCACVFTCCICLQSTM